MNEDIEQILRPYTLPLLHVHSNDEPLRKEQEPNTTREPLDLLLYAAQTPFNSYDRRHNPTCLPDTQLKI